MSIQGLEGRERSSDTPLDSSPKEIPSFLGTLLFDQLDEPIFEHTCKNGLASLRTPDEMIDDQVNPMLISLIVHSVGVWRFHSSFVQHIQQNCKRQGLKPTRKGSCRGLADARCAGVGTMLNSTKTCRRAPQATMAVFYSSFDQRGRDVLVLSRCTLVALVPGVLLMRRGIVRL